MHLLKAYLSDLGESVPEFAIRVGASRQTLYRIIHSQQSPKPALARRIVEATGGEVPFEALFPGQAGSEGAVVSIDDNNDALTLDPERLRLALAIVVNHMTPQDKPEISDETVDIAAEAVANTFIALSTVTTRQGQDRLCQALRPVLEETLRESSGTQAPVALDQGAALAAQLYFQMWNIDHPRKAATPGR